MSEARIIDEIVTDVNQHTTAAVGSIDLSPVKLAVEDNMSNLMLNGYTQKMSYCHIPSEAHESSLKNIASVQGGGYLERFICTSTSVGKGKIRITVDDRVILYIRVEMYQALHGIALNESVTRVGENTVDKQVGLTSVYGNVLGTAYSGEILGNENLRDLSGTAGGNLVLVPSMIRFKRNLKIEFVNVTNGINGKSAIFYSYYVKTGGGN